MGSRSAELRRAVFKTGSPLVNHSLNQRKINDAESGKIRLFGESKKQQRSERNRARKLDEFQQINLSQYQKIRNIIEVVHASIRGADDTDLRLLPSQLRYLLSHNVFVKGVDYSMISQDTEENAV